LVTLGGMFFARGAGFLLSARPIDLTHPGYRAAGALAVHLADRVNLHGYAALSLLVVAAGIYAARFTRFGRNTYAVGGNEQSALLMGLPVARTKVGIYALAGFCSALAGVVATLAMPKGDPNAGLMMELDVIAAVVIGGTLLSGGVGSVFGTYLGVTILSIIQTAINFQGSLSPWWVKIAMGLLLLFFILLQKLVQWKL